MAAASFRNECRFQEVMKAMDQLTVNVNQLNVNVNQLTERVAILEDPRSNTSSKNPDDPHAIKGYRPRVNRTAVKQLLGGVKDGILDSANGVEDDLSRKLAQTNVSDRTRGRTNTDNHANPTPGTSK